MPKLSRLIIIFLFLIGALNLFTLDFLLLLQDKKTTSKDEKAVFLEWVKEEVEDTCGSLCQKMIDEKIIQAIATVSATPKTSKTTAAFTALLQPSSKPSSIKITSLISLGSGSSTINTNWTRVDGSEVMFNLSDYAEGTVYWEGNLRAQSGNSRCYARLFDKTNSRAVDYSEQSTDQLTNQYLTTQPLTIWYGKLNYQLEIKSLNGVACYLDSPRLVIVYSK